MDHVRRQSGLHLDSSDDEFSLDNDEADMAANTSPSLPAHITTPPTSNAKSSSPQPRSTLSMPAPPTSSPRTTRKTAGQQHLTVEDLEICQRLDEEYERALEEREIGYNARYASVRQSAVLSVCFMVAFLSLGTTFFMRQAAWTIPESMLFSIYTITTVGYGRQEMPTTPGFQAYTIFYILVGIAALTIMVSDDEETVLLENQNASV